MLHMSDKMEQIFDVNKLDLLTEEEKKFNENYVKKLSLYADGKIEGIHIKNLTAGAATIAKRQQSRSAVAMLKYNVVNRQEKDRQDHLLLNNKEQIMIESKSNET